MKKIIFFYLGWFLLKTSPALAWGHEGHEITAEIAEKYLNKNTLDSVKHYLKETSFKEASIWMDKVRKDPNYAFLKPTHYINIEKDKTYVKLSKPNIMNKLDDTMSLLQNRKGKSKEEIKRNLLFLFHLIGDLHQPLHVGYGEDRGGNSIRLQFLTAHTTLHQMWDYKIIRRKKISSQNCENYLNNLSKKEKEKIQKIDFVVWLKESRSHLATVYDFNNNIIDEAYIAKNKPVIEQQLAKAGLRLASALNQIFAK